MIRTQIFTVNQRHQNVSRICVPNKTFRRPHICAVVNMSNFSSVLLDPVTVTSNCRYCLTQTSFYLWTQANWKLCLKFEGIFS